MSLSSNLSALPARDASTVGAEVGRRLRAAITLNEIPPGSRLTQTSLAEQLGVSRMPVRDAISDLVAEGFAEALPTGGAVVTGLSSDDMRAVYAVRAPLEVEATRWVASNPDADLREIDRILTVRRELGAGGPQTLWDLDRDFHWAIYNAAGNRFLTAALAPLWSQISRIMFAVHTVLDYGEVAWSEHAAIADAIRAGDVEEAERVRRAHITHSADMLIESASSAVSAD